MKRLIYTFINLSILLFGFNIRVAFSQVLLSSSGTSYTNTDAVTTDTYGPVNASCGYVTFTIDYSSSLPWAGSGNMESASECSACLGDPDNPTAGGCPTCWDFFYVEYVVGGVVVGTDLVGAGLDVQTASFSFTQCISAPTSVSMNVYTQTWASDETISFSNIQISCGSINANPSSTSTNCGQNNGQACVAPTGGNSPYTYGWSGGQTTACLNNIPAGNYDVTITDDNGCTQTETIVVSNINANINANPSSTSTNCGQNNGQACVAPTGGNSPYTYDWSGGQTTACLNNIPAGNYDVTITDDNGCTQTETIVVSNINANINANPSSTSTNCGQNNGQACVAPTGGNSPYTYDWSGGQTTACLNNIPAGNYDVTITDDNGCTQTETIIVSNINANINANPSSTSTNCGQSNGQACVAPTGGNSPYTYDWSGGQTTACLNNIPAGNYDVTITDDNGCTQTETIVVSNINANINANPSSTSTNCGQSNGQACVAPTGGNSPYTYDWSGGQTTACLNNVIAGTYNVTITDDNGCTQTASVTVTNVGATINANPSSTSTNCGQSNGQACVAPTGGAVPYSYIWSGGQTTACLNNIAAGTYSVTITDDNNCTQTASVTVTNVGATINANPSSTSTNCGQSNGQVCVAPTGGAAPYSYTWSGGQTTACLNNVAAGSYSVTITDDNNCTQTASVTVTNVGATINANPSSTSTNCGQSNGQACVAPTGGTAPYTYAWSGGQTTACLNNVAAGSYSVTITDDNNCTQTASVTVTNVGATINANPSSTSTNCGQSNGQACVTPTGGAAPYSYTWSGGQTTACLNNVSAGSYSVTITDDNGCSQTASVTVTNLSNFQANLSAQDETCANLCDGEIQVQASGGTTPYQYSIDNGVTFQTNALFSGLCSGTYIVLAQDANACSFTQNLTISPGQNSYSLSIDSILPVCTSSSNIMMQANTLNGSWLGNGILDPISGEFSPSMAGLGTHLISYYLPGNSCADTAYSHVLVLNTSSITFNNQQACQNSSIFQMQVSPFGGVFQGPGLLDVSLGTVNTNALSPGQYNYTYIVSGACGDTAQAVLTILANDSIQIAALDTMCLDQAPFQLLSANSNGTWTGDGVYGLNPSFFSPSLAGAGAHTVYYNNSTSCVGMDSIQIYVRSAASIDAEVSQWEGCVPLTVDFMNPQVDQLTTWVVNGSILSEQNNFSHTFNEPGTYALTAQVIDRWGCKSSMVFSKQIEVFSFPEAEIQSQHIKGTFEYVLRSKDITENALWEIEGSYFSGRTIRYNFGDTGDYEVCLIVANAFGCSDTVCINMEIRTPFFNAYIPNTFTPDEDGVNDVYIPVLTDYEVIEYHFSIFDRWGNKVYDTQIPKQGWNGYYKNQEAKQDVYDWKLEFIDPETGTHFSQAGFVLLLR